jgi:hypothetical protein
MQYLTPTTWTAKDGYKLSEDPAVWIACQKAKFHTLFVMTCGVLTSMTAVHATLRPEDEYVQLVFDQLKGAKATLQALAMGGGGR